MKTFFSKITGLVVGLGIAVGAVSAFAAGGPTNKPREVEWSFAGPFGTWDYAQLQRGWQIYQENCSACHTVNLLSFRHLEGIGFSENKVKAIAAEYDIEEDDDDRPGKPIDRIPGPDVSDFVPIPPDFSLLAKARAPERGFPTFIFDVFTLYAENGPDYIYSLLTGYQDAPEGVDEGDSYYNPYFISGDLIGMSPPLSEDNFVEYEDESVEASLDQNAKDVAAFMMWAAEPTLVERKQLGFKVIIFLLIFSVLLYLSKKQVFMALKSKK